MIFLNYFQDKLTASLDVDIIPIQNLSSQINENFEPPFCGEGFVNGQGSLSSMYTPKWKSDCVFENRKFRSYELVCNTTREPMPLIFSFDRIEGSSQSGTHCPKWTLCELVTNFVRYCDGPSNVRYLYGPSNIPKTTEINFVCLKYTGWRKGFYLEWHSCCDKGRCERLGLKSSSQVVGRCGIVGLGEFCGFCPSEKGEAIKEGHFNEESSGVDLIGNDRDKCKMMKNLVKYFNIVHSSSGTTRIHYLDTTKVSIKIDYKTKTVLRLEGIAKAE
eukprot:GHVP01025605.1.p1 GENE.GHVP01025605.1~~GHVP01025605.1.p1  ORF type:complete len:274 (+),score=31.38 GHVP01025605.1:1181-2002(+)